MPQYETAIVHKPQVQDLQNKAKQLDTANTCHYDPSNKAGSHQRRGHLFRIGNHFRDRIMALREAAFKGVPSCMYALERGVAGGSFAQARSIGSWVPEYFGKKSKYTEGTEFLGTPKDHQQRIKNRPMSPDVLDIDGKSLHYKLPIGAMSSIANRVTGVGMSVGMMGAGFIALTGDLPGTMSYIKSCGPLMTIPLKGLIAFPIVYHYVAGVRHLLWDHGKISDQADKSSMLDLEEIKKSSEFVLYGSAGLSALLALYYYTA